MLEAMRPGAGKRATRFADHQKDVQRVLTDAIQSAFADVQHDGDQTYLPRDTARQMNRAVFTGLARKLLLEAGTPADRVDAKQLARVARAVRDKEGGERTFEFANGVTLTVTRDRVTIG